MRAKLLSSVCFMGLVLSPSIWGMEMSMMQDDERTSLGIKGTMQGEHQLSNMREHLSAISDIVRLMNTNKYDEASKIATEKLGLTLEKNSMCGSFKNQSFEQVGVSFHKAGDNLAQTLKTKDHAKSMVALEKVLNGCVMCHSTFKQ
ncbi:MAG: cytochrome c [Sulfuricurvum sp.]|nr:cytochrome c [Sulfuricurvum sp.]